MTASDRQQGETLLGMTKEEVSKTSNRNYAVIAATVLTAVALSSSFQNAAAAAIVGSCFTVAAHWYVSAAYYNAKKYFTDQKVKAKGRTLGLVEPKPKRSLLRDFGIATGVFTGAAVAGTGVALSALAGDYSGEIAHGFILMGTTISGVAIAYSLEANKRQNSSKPPAPKV